MLYVASMDRFDIVNAPGGKGPAFTVYFAGCTLRCPGCQNPLLRSRNNGTRVTVEYVMRQLQNSKRYGIDKYNDVVLLGGEPTEQPAEDFIELLRQLHAGGYNIWLYTGYELREIPRLILSYCYTIKTGRYVEALRTEGTLLASSNQKFYRWDWDKGNLVLKETAL